jgi:dephospho-CoA kinase
MKKIAVIGQQCSGKTTAANFIAAEHHAPMVLKFAQPIYDAINALKQPKHRAFMQQFGDLAKTHFGELVFTNIFKERVIEIQNSDFFDLLVCDDMRRQHELDAAREMGFKLISIDATAAVRKRRADAQGFAFIENHSSETEVPILIPQADYIIKDDGISMEELKFECQMALAAIR